MSLGKGGPRADDLTLAEMQKRFSEVRDHYRKSGDVDQSIVCRNLLCTRLDDLQLSRVEIKDSSLHGSGVFATRDLAENELITFYPGDSLLIWDDADRSPSRDVTVIFGAHVPEERRDSRRILGEEARSFEQKANVTTSLVGDPECLDDTAYIGHMCNDGASCLTGADCEAYTHSSEARANAYHVGLEGCHIATIATREILSGEEVLVSYGEDYWLSRGGNEATTISPDTPISIRREQTKQSKKASKQGARARNSERGFGRPKDA
ncbi:hypothetical protein CYMTET_48753 [Cymbomonas tetramitiformis]|uniref:SET domain-containing protein n=1 Tax=Cymbomonas tetramitiformis TaxID=36881 RepID=A0AAE0BTC7_9CHLO|nr:hypothetical protein CYMTET_48753 [Cymbomonas tetramitiformis]|eukprot:gene26739-32852_t